MSKACSSVLDLVRRRRRPPGTYVGHQPDRADGAPAAGRDVEPVLGGVDQVAVGGDCGPVGRGQAVGRAQRGDEQGARAGRSAGVEGLVAGHRGAPLQHRPVSVAADHLRQDRVECDARRSPLVGDQGLLLGARTGLGRVEDRRLRAGGGDQSDGAVDQPGADVLPVVHRALEQPWLVVGQVDEHDLCGGGARPVGHHLPVAGRVRHQSGVVPPAGDHHDGTVVHEQQLAAVRLAVGDAQ